MDLEQMALLISLAANIVTMGAFLFALMGAIKTRDHFIRQRTFDRMQMLYCLAMDLWRAGLTAQTQRQRGVEPNNREQIQLATYALKNWYHDNRFMFETHPCGALTELVQSAANEAKFIPETGDMSELKMLLRELESRITTLARGL